MTLKEIYRRFLEELQQVYSTSEAAIVTERVFESVAQLHRADMIKTPGLVIDEKLTERLNTCLQELLSLKPVQYVLGEAWFYNMQLKVNKHVLIPRPETEELVKLVIEDYKDVTNDAGISIIDIGAGSGCIAIALKKNLPAASLTAIDVSIDALLISKENAAAQEAEILFLELDFLKKDQWERLKKFDVIVSNPPYIPLDEKEKLDENVTAFEPHTALFVPAKNPLLFYEAIALFGLAHLNAGGKIFVEVHEDFAQETAAAFSTLYEQIYIKEDLFGKRRMIAVGKPR